MPLLFVLWVGRQYGRARGAGEVAVDGATRNLPVVHHGPLAQCFAAVFRDKPVSGVLNTWSELNTRHSHFRERVKDVKRGARANSPAPCTWMTAIPTRRA
jgi:dihydroxyacid dehydratase/phosphogluconate dehydratase